MILVLVQNVALLVTLIVVLLMLYRRLKPGSLAYVFAAGILFGAVAMAGMATPVHFAAGVIYDGRSIVLGLAGLFGGPVTAVVAALMSGAYRLYPVSYTHLRAHETVLDLVCRLLLEKKKKKKKQNLY